MINEIVYKVPWEKLGKGPTGEYIEVVDYDPSSGFFYKPVDLNDTYLVAQDGHDPSEGIPQFHQQMVYAVSMTTIRNFEKALGRWIFWAPRCIESQENGKPSETKEIYEHRLRIYPHALREANAYYSPDKKALLFGYFPAFSSSAQFPGGMVFTCLSHDIITHETTHALLDGMHRRYIEPTNMDCHAFHEAFSDIVALFQHFTFPEVLEHQIARTRGDLASQNLLGELAQQFGQSIGHYGSLRSALGSTDENGQWHPAKPDPEDYRKVNEAHARGSILVGAVFDAFLTIYKSRIADLLRIATGGSGVLPQGELQSDLVYRLSVEASKSARHVLNMCIRALDYCPPVDITFGDYLRALITADYDLVSDDSQGYRVAFTEAFRKRGIFPAGIRTLSPDSIRWPKLETDLARMKDAQSFNTLSDFLRDVVDRSKYLKTREESFEETLSIREKLHQRIIDDFDDSEEFKRLTGLVLSKNEEMWPETNGEPLFEVESFRAAQRVGPDDQMLNQAIVSITQKRTVQTASGQSYLFRGGCTLILDLNDMRLRYCISKGIDDKKRMERQAGFMFNEADLSLRATYFGDGANAKEKFALLHQL